jgi:hypothetical protein
MTPEERRDYIIAHDLQPKIYVPPDVGKAVVNAGIGVATTAVLADGLVNLAADALFDAGSTAENLLAQCFPAGTLVAACRGLIPIEQVKARDEVWAYDLVTSKWCLCVVLKTFVRDHDGTSATITVAGEEIEATALHPFWVVNGEDLKNRPVREHLASVPDDATTPGRWVDAIDIRVGDELLLRDGRILPVEKVRQQPYCDKVYNFHVEDLQCYAVGCAGALVHNSNGVFSELPEATRDAVLRARDFAEAAAQVWKDIGRAEEAASTWANAEALSEYINGEGGIAPEALMWIIENFG